jgi:hypothetical protein
MVEISRERRKEEETVGQMLEARSKQLDKDERRVKPCKLRGQVRKWAAAIDTSDPRAAINKPIQSNIQTRRVENSRGAEKIHVARELRQSAGDEKRTGKSGATKRSGRKRSRLDDNRSDRKWIRVGSKSKWDSSKLRSDGKPCNSAIGKEGMTAGAGGGGWHDAGVGGWNAR